MPWIFFSSPSSSAGHFLCNLPNLFNVEKKTFDCSLCWPEHDELCKVPEVQPFKTTQLLFWHPESRLKFHPISHNDSSAYTEGTISWMEQKHFHQLSHIYHCGWIERRTCVCERPFIDDCSIHIIFNNCGKSFSLLFFSYQSRHSTVFHQKLICLKPFQLRVLNGWTLRTIIIPM